MGDPQKPEETPIEPTPEELAEEKDAQAEKSEDEVRAEVIERYGLDAEENKEQIDKIVEDQMTAQKTLSKAIGQKIKHRDARKPKPPEGTPPTPTPPTPPAPETPEPTPAEQAQNVLDERDLEDSDLTDEVKEEAKNYAKLHKVSIREALKSGYITHLKTESEKKTKETGASVGSTPNAPTQQTPKSLEEFKANDFDLSTEQGRKDHAEWKKAQGIG